MELLKKYGKLIPYFVIILLVIYIRECNPKPLPCPDIATEIDTLVVWDTVKLAGKTIYKPDPYAVYTTVHDTIFKTHTDTVKAIIDYSLIRNYRLNIHNDTLGNIDVLTTIQYNKISTWHYEGQIYNKNTIIEKNHYVIEEKRTKIFAGAVTGYSLLNDKPVFSPSVALLTRNEHLYLIGYDVLNKTPEIGLYWKIKLKK